MATKEQAAVVDKLVTAYEHMLERIRTAAERTEQETIPVFRELLHKTRDNMIDFGELTREEAHKVAEYLERDIEEAARYIAETGEDLERWWRFDLNLVEQRIRELFSQVADQTSVQLLDLAQRARRANPYRAGEITGPGTLVCTACGAETHHHRTERILPCTQCRATDFKRLPGNTDTD